MKFTVLISIFSILTATALASAPNPSYTNLNINTAPRTAISKSRVTSKLGRRAPLTSDNKASVSMKAISHAIRDASARAGRRNMMSRKKSSKAVPERPQHQSRYRSNAVRDAATDAVRVRSAMSGMIKRIRTQTADKSTGEQEVANGLVGTERAEDEGMSTRRDSIRNAMKKRM